MKSVAASDVHLYSLKMGTADRSGWYESDEKAKKVAERWVRLFFFHFCKKLKPGSVAYRLNHNNPYINIYRHNRKSIDGRILRNVINVYRSPLEV